MEMEKVLESVVSELNELEKLSNINRGYRFQTDQWHILEKKKFIHLNIGGSGAFLIEKETGEIFNIKGYGVPDHNKKKKADLGNIFTVNVKELHQKRFNYLR